MNGHLSSENGKGSSAQLFRRVCASREGNTKWERERLECTVGANGYDAPALSIVIMAALLRQPDANIGHPKRCATFATYESLEDTKKFSAQQRSVLAVFTGGARLVTAPVEFRGVRIGTVNGVSFRYLPNDPERRVPVLIQVDPSFITNLPSENTEAAENFVADAVRNGMRASLKTGNLLTGQLYVDLDFQKDAPAAT